MAYFYSYFAIICAVCIGRSLQHFLADFKDNLDLNSFIGRNNIEEEDILVRLKRQLIDVTDQTDNVMRTRTVIPQTSACGINGISLARIRQGGQAGPKDWPWMAVLLRKEDYLNFCGGVLINRRYILTAAHCVHKKKIEEYVVRLGEYDFTSPNETEYIDFEVEHSRPHADYDSSTQRHDIALLRLNRDVPYNAYIRPICMPKTSARTNQTVIVAGWGTLFYGGPQSDVLMEVPVPVWDWNTCVSKYTQKVYPTNICAAGYDGGKDSCQGDSGGPLLMQAPNGRWTTIGVVSWGVACGEKDQPGIYTRVESYINWIGTYTQDASP